MTSIEDEARVEAERRWPGEDETNSDEVAGFVKGYVAGATRAQGAEPELHDIVGWNEVRNERRAEEATREPSDAEVEAALEAAEKGLGLT